MVRSLALGLAVTALACAPALDDTTTPESATAAVEAPAASQPSGPVSTTAALTSGLAGDAPPPVDVPEYNRDDWGGWADADHDCQDTRAEILISRSSAPVAFATDRECRVVSGQWIDFYSGETLTDASVIDVDHVVALKTAHEAGGHAWPRDRRHAYVNDTANLVLTHRHINRSKGSKRHGDWLPEPARCRFVEVSRATAARWALDPVLVVPVDWGC